MPADHEDAGSHFRAVLLPAGLASFLTVLPILASHHLPLVDAPAHEARLAVLWRMLCDGGVSSFYTPGNFLLPNIGFETVGLPFAGLVGPETIGRSFFALTLLLTLWGILILNRAVNGRWSRVPLVTVILLYNLVGVLGFFSYAFGIALVLWALACRLTFPRSRPGAGLVLGATFGVLLLFCHAFAFGVYAATRAVLPASTVTVRRIRFGNVPVAGLELMPALAIFLVMSRGRVGYFAYLTPFVQVKAAGLVEAMSSGSLTGDGALAIGLIVFVLLAAFSEKVTLAPGFALVLALLFGLYLALPFELGSGANVDKRMPIAIAFLALAGLDMKIRRDWTSYWIVAVVVVALVTKQVALMVSWRSFDPTIDGAVSALKALPQGAVMMQTECHLAAKSLSSAYGKWQPPMTHLAALATFDGDRFAASSWAIPGQQPMTVKSRYEPYSRLQAGFPSSSCSAGDYRDQIAQIELLAARDGAPAPPIYFFVIRPPAPNMLESTADFIAAGRDFELYAVRTPG